MNDRPTKVVLADPAGVEKKILPRSMIERRDGAWFATYAEGADLKYRGFAVQAGGAANLCRSQGYDAAGWDKDEAVKDISFRRIWTADLDHFYKPASDCSGMGGARCDRHVTGLLCQKRARITEVRSGY